MSAKAANAKATMDSIKGIRRPIGTYIVNFPQESRYSASVFFCWLVRWSLCRAAFPDDQYRDSKTNQPNDDWPFVLCEERVFGKLFS
jgi:hypothetical protein